ncbi:MAG: Hsp33 family molecular chaperone HslO [Chloroflexi bacterium]|nr:Hsp33 family molecular chaperone HslO [Chloroflexota bacterium]
MKDYLVRAIAKDAGVRGLFALTTNLAREGTERHETVATSTIALGEGLTAVALMGALLKVRQRVALKFEGNGPLKKIVVESDSYGKVRGYVGNPNVDLPQNENNGKHISPLGKVGLMTVVKDLKLKELSEGVVPIAGNRIDEELTYYLTQSEQIPSIVEIGVYTNDAGDIEVSGGLLVQALPPYDIEIVDQIRNRVQELPPIGDLLHAGQTPESILDRLFEGFEYEILENRDLLFKCTCSRERTEKALISLGRVEIETFIANEEEAIIDCHFCHSQYVFGVDDLEDILIELD